MPQRPPESRESGSTADPKRRRTNGDQPTACPTERSWGSDTNSWGQQVETSWDDGRENGRDATKCTMATTDIQTPTAAATTMSPSFNKLGQVRMMPTLAVDMEAPNLMSELPPPNCFDLPAPPGMLLGMPVPGTQPLRIPIAIPDLAEAANTRLWAMGPVASAAPSSVVYSARSWSQEADAGFWD